MDILKTQVFKMPYFFTPIASPPFRAMFTNCFPCQFVNASFCCAKTPLLHGTTAVLAQNEPPCSFWATSLLTANLLLLETTVIRGSSATLGIFSSGTGARSSSSAFENSLLNSVLPCTLFNGATAWSHGHPCPFQKC